MFLRIESETEKGKTLYVGLVLPHSDRNSPTFAAPPTGLGEMLGRGGNLHALNG